MGIFTNLVVGAGGGGGLSTYGVTLDGTTYTGVKTASDSTISQGEDFTTVMQDILTDKGSDFAGIALGNGTFTVDTLMNWRGADEDNFWLYGQGPGITTIEGSTSLAATSAIIDMQSNNQNTEHAISNTAIGDTVVTLTTGSEEENYQAGDIIRLKDETVIGTAASEKNGGFYRVKSVTTDDSGEITIYGNILEVFSSTPAVVNQSRAVGASTNQWHSNVRISDMTINDLRTTASATDATGIRIRFMDNFGLENVNFTNNWRAALGLRAAYNSRISNCSFTDINEVSSISYGIDVSASEHTTITNCGFDNCRHAVTCTSGQDATSSGNAIQGRVRGLTVSNCVSKNTTQAHFDTHDGCRDIVFNGLTCIGSNDQTDNYGIQTRSPAIISNCNMFGGFKAGIQVFSTLNTPISCVISNNSITGVYETGMLFGDRVANSLITGNKVIMGTSAATTRRCIDLVRTGAGDLAGIGFVINNNYFDGSGDTEDGIFGDSVTDVTIKNNYFLNMTDAVDIDDTDTATARIYIRENVGRTITNATPFAVAGANTGGSVANNQDN